MSEEKEKAAAELEERERLAKQLEEEKKTLEEATTHLKGDLMVRDFSDLHLHTLSQSHKSPGFIITLVIGREAEAN